ncbi:hypothetical protein KA344_16330 [bacterium]|nr:hypothetical protein [bacterium]
MTSSTNKLTNAKPAKAKALLAIAFAGNLLTAQLPALGQESPKGLASAIESITKSVRGTPEEKAYYLLQLAYCYITGGNAAALETQFKAGLGQLGNSNMFRFSPRGEHPLVSLANRVSLLSHSAGAVAPTEIGKKKISSEDRAVADKAIEAAIAQLGQGIKNTETLNLYLIASYLSRMTGNSQNEQKCNRILDDAIQACEGSKTVNSSQIKVFAQILNSMAYGLIPIQIPDNHSLLRQQTMVFDVKYFDESEKLKLRAAALLDRLPATDHERRKAHRDLALWYLKLGKDEKSLKEKQELFTLIGVEDDRMLYPTSGMCGHSNWWEVGTSIMSGLCGMG